MTSAGIALVTGASSGIGLEIARELAARHYDLVLTARSAEKLQALANDLSAKHAIKTHVVADDLLDPQAPVRIRDWLGKAGIAIDILVNNAGFGLSGPFRSLPIDGQLGILQVNVSALTHLTGLLLPTLLTRPKGHILNIASTAGFVPLPYLAVYAASKAYVIAFSEALSIELKKTNVTVTCACPGATSTDFARRAGMEQSSIFRTIRAPDSVARRSLDAMFAAKRLHIIGRINRGFVIASRLAPRRVVLRLAERRMK